MIGINASTGASITGIDHLRQSVLDILRTRKGSRVMRRDYGSLLPDLVDSPTNAAGIADIVAATADALARWEARIRVTNVSVYAAGVGVVEITITGKYLIDGKSFVLEGLQI
jgi:hypothetical protein